MKESTKKPILVAIARKLALRVFLITALLAGSVSAVYAALYNWGCHDGYCYYLSCGSSAGNYWARCPQNCQSCPCEPCDTGPCQTTADEQCARGGHPPLEEVGGGY